jgi:uncharacterized protein
MRWIILGALLTAFSGPVLAQTFPERPGPRELIVDEAGLIDPRDRSAVRDTCNALRSEKKIPIVVATIRALADYGARDAEKYARALFDHWGIGSRDWNRGILLLVALGDRRARIELGADWAGSANEQCEAIMEALMASFRRGDFSQGLRVAVSQLADLARGRTPEVRDSASNGSPWEVITVLIIVSVWIAVRVAVLPYWVSARRSSRRRRGKTGRSAPRASDRFTARRRFDRYWAAQGVAMALGWGGFGGGGGATGSW